MTVCIAAICEDGKRIVVAADRMFTAGAPVNLEFETEEQKIESLAPSCVAMMSGNSGYGTEVLIDVRQRLAGSQTPAIADVAKHAELAYRTVRAKKADETIIAPTLGQDFAGFLSRGGTLPAYLQTQPAMYQQLSAAMNQFNMSLDVVIAGIDNAGARIARIAHPGTLVWLDKLGYDAIGSGGIHALTRLYLGAQTRHRQLSETLYAVYDAKKASERAPGVGKDTDMAVIEGGKVQQCSRVTLDALESIHQETNKKLAPDLKGLKDAMEKEKK
jgi:hypothetical protein